ncbi:hypothetical protein psal_cds_1220 [Pandoravirus salinus]|uniref:Uncharacterized protein n=1 Tax=Pandoravirus salinus TaxID=1349410 RepID=S4W5B8_9VIRU|nr:hypothetical protein psal_cds_1220 [Pandoravirus salinus]AGO85530.1 hypothetical protein psal_cds_1220 [Pandoravirus salinus]
MRSLDAVRPRPWSAGLVLVCALAAGAAVLGAGTWLALVMRAMAVRAEPIDCRPCPEIEATSAGLLLSGVVVGFAAGILAAPLQDKGKSPHDEGIVHVATAAA